MVCLLCYECSDDNISLSCAESHHSNISSILFKYFRFIFETEPIYGVICRKCWIKVEMFHVFYQQIEEIQTKISKVDPLVVETDVRDGFEFKAVSNQNQTKNTNFKIENHDSDFVRDFWPDNSDGFQCDLKTENTLPNGSRDEKNISPKVTPKSSLSKSKSKKHLNRNVTSSKESAIGIVDCVNGSDFHTCLISRKCVKRFETKDALIAHCAMDHKRFHCTHCPNIRLFADLYKHLRDVHGIIENAICEHCGQIFGLNRTLQEHIKRKHTVSDPVQCDICKEWFKSRETIRSHMNYVHIQGPQACGICGKISANRKALRTHLTIHSDAWKDKFKCVICDKGFRSSTKLREHSYIHSGKTDAYTCQFCGKSFRFNSSISTHRMKYHPVEMAHVKERLQRKRNMEFKV